ncbi:hypothetical protein Har1130_06780 [Haloarcula sp. CBA1130]|uniref:sulfatase-like hydrolase/transferase n=1 Tax=unclassified Haloarcula TaxID=2624677 RepID=UPI001246551A|nr:MULTISPECIES: sulfatase-like hydrolase/transferase [unclassified Haloarcula]KAA9397857.1 hypothetical protein Har1129_06360 [Haloarcula sp. CBA1129]KAA9402455.1 hypothetical protein Har1130_06780 [Haloarcula sp. CBA1130]
MQVPDIFLLVLDSLRYDYVDPDCNESSNTPNLQRLINDGIYFNETYSTGSWTVPAHGSLFSDTLPSESGIGGEKRIFDCKNPLAERIRSRGYQTIGISANPWITKDFEYDRGFDRFSGCFPDLPFNSNDPRKEIKKIDTKSFSRSYLELAKWIFSDNRLNRFGNSIYSLLSDQLPYMNAEQLTDRAIEEIDNSSSPRFFFANYMDAHEPYTEESRLNENIAWNLESVGVSSQPDPENVSGIYANDVRFLDQAIGTFIDHLKNAGLYKDSLLVVLGDHGQALGEHDYWGHGTFLYKPLIKIPAIVKPPAGEDMSEPEYPVSIIDIYELIDKVSDSIDLHSLSLPSREYVVAESFGTHESKEIDWVPDEGYRAIITNDCFGILNLKTKEIELIDPDTDSARKKINGIASRDNLMDELMTEGQVEKVDDAVSERLEQLGYK